MMRISGVSVSFSAFKSFFDGAKAVSLDSGRKYHNLLQKNTKSMTFKSVSLDFDGCTFTNTSGIQGGAVYARGGEITIKSCVFYENKAKYGGALYIEHTKKLLIQDSSFISCRSERFGSLYLNGENNGTKITLLNMNVTGSIGEEYISGLRIEKCCYSMKESVFSGCHSKVFGAHWDWTDKPSVSQIQSCLYINNTSETPGACFVGYHWMHRSEFTDVSFFMSQSPSPRAVFLYSVDSIVTLVRCSFSGTKDEEIGSKYGKCELQLRETKFSFSMPPS